MHRNCGKRGVTVPKIYRRAETDVKCPAVYFRLPDWRAWQTLSSHESGPIQSRKEYPDL
jgi:hypothetical protein